MRFLEKYFYWFVSGGLVLGLLWLQLRATPNLVVANVESAQKVYNENGKVVGTKRVRKGAIFVNVTTARGNDALRMVGDPVPVTSYGRGLQSAITMLPLALICAICGSIPSYFVGKWFAMDCYKGNAELLIASYDDKIRRAEEKLRDAEGLKRQAFVENREAAQTHQDAREIEKAAAVRVALADERVADVERKLAKEHEDHQKTIAQLLKYKNKCKPE